MPGVAANDASLRPHRVADGSDATGGARRAEHDASGQDWARERPHAALGGQGNG
jgi:hypothetical protein